MKTAALLLTLILPLQGCAVIDWIDHPLQPKPLLVPKSERLKRIKEIPAFCAEAHLPDYPEAYDYCIEQRGVRP